MTGRIPAICLSIALMAGAMASSAYATPDDDQDDSSQVESVVVTGSMRVRQGGVQDINHFRGDATAKKIPLPDTLTPEGLMGGYDLLIGSDKPCAQLFCLGGEAMRADLILKPQDKILIGLGFASNVQADKWQRQPLNLVAVVDKSGSMDGQPLALVRESLRQILSQLRPGDQMSIILYGDTAAVFMDPILVTADNKGQIRSRINAIASAGSTDMESGLRVGYDTAFASAPGFKGVTRVMLFTDEQPNVNATDAESFMGMAQSASERGIGLTTIGVGEQFDGPLATRISSVRGGNLYFMRDEADIKSVFTGKLDTMVSELGYNVKILLKPQAGYKISAVYGVPAEVLGWQEGDAVTITVPTVFFSTEGGGIFVTLARDPDSAYLPAPPASAAGVLQAEMSYISALDGKLASDAVTVAAPAGKPSTNLALGNTLIDEFLLLQQGTSLYHRESDVRGAYAAFKQLSDRLAQAPDPRLKPERELAADLLAQSGYLAGMTSEPPSRVRWMSLYGEWEVTRVNGDIKLSPGDTLELTDDNQSIITRISERLYSDADESQFQATRSELYIKGAGAVFSYHFEGDTMILEHRDTGSTVVLKRLS